MSVERASICLSVSAVIDGIAVCMSSKLCGHEESDLCLASFAFAHVLDDMKYSGTVVR